MELIFGGKNSRGKLSLEYRPDIIESEEAKSSTSLDERISRSKGDLLIKPYASQSTDVFITGEYSEFNLGTSQLNVGPDASEIDGSLQSAMGGLGFKWTDFDDSSFLMAVEYGSSSDRLFGESKNNVLQGILAYSLSPEIDSQWVFLINYSNNRTYLNNIPIPTFAYVYRPSEKTSITMGLPFFSINHFDFPNLTYALFLSPGGGGYDLGVGVLGPLQIFNSFSYKIDAYFHENRTDVNTRLFVEEKSVEVGLRSPLSRSLSLMISYGFAFDRFYYEGEGLFDPTGEISRLPNDNFLKSRITIRF